MRTQKSNEIYSVWVDQEMVTDPTAEKVTDLLRSMLLQMTYEQRYINTVIVRIKYAALDHSTSYSKDILGIISNTEEDGYTPFEIMEKTAEIILRTKDLPEEVIEFINR